MKRTLRDAKLARKKMELEANTIKAKLENALRSVNCITQEYRELQKQVTDLKKRLDVQNVSFSQAMSLLDDDFKEDGMDVCLQSTTQQSPKDDGMNVSSPPSTPQPVKEDGVNILSQSSMQES